MKALRRLRTAGPARTGRIGHARRERAKREGGVTDQVVRVLECDAPADAGRGSQGREGEHDGDEDGDRRAPVPRRPPGALARSPFAEPDPDQHGQHDHDRQHHELRPDQRAEEAEDERGNEPRTARLRDSAREHVQDEGRIRIGDRLLHQQARIEHPGDRDRGDRRGERGQPSVYRRASRYAGHNRERHDESADQLGHVVRGDRVVKEPRRRDDCRVEDARHGAERR